VPTVPTWHGRHRDCTVGTAMARRWHGRHGNHSELPKTMFLPHGLPRLLCHSRRNRGRLVRSRSAPSSRRYTELSSKYSTFCRLFFAFVYVCQLLSTFGYVCLRLTNTHLQVFRRAQLDYLNRLFHNCHKKCRRVEPASKAGRTLQVCWHTCPRECGNRLFPVQAWTYAGNEKAQILLSNLPCEWLPSKKTIEENSGTYSSPHLLRRHL